ncbi:MAG: hypothetical protein ACTHXC_00515 [Brachybacterium sp.]
MSYTVRNKHGEDIAGDDELDDAMKNVARQAGGWIVDDDEQIVYHSQEEN